MNKTGLETATFAGGCFWCTEAIFKGLKGVEKVVSGYAGGTMPQPSYEAVSSGTTGHTEAIQITFDPNQISYETLLEVFFATHDPTTPNRQGADVGSQYRSVIFYHDAAQKRTAEKLKKEIVGAVTEIIPFTNFYPAEAYHQNYYAQNLDKPYCQVVINPKLTKLREKFSRLLKN